MGILFEDVSHYYYGLKKKNVTKAIENINLNIDSHDEFVAIVGKTGSGKSTLVEHMNALMLPTHGNIKIFEYNITPKKRKNPKLKNIRKKVGFVFQFPEYQLFEETVLKDIMFGPINFGYTKEEALNKANEVMELLNIKELKDKSPFNLSGGQMRRVAIASILAYDPEIIVLDEPTRGLDPKGASEIMDLFKEIQEKTHKSFVMITHDMNVMYEYAKRVVVLNKHKITYDGNKVDLFKKDIYKENHLVKPDVLNLIDFLNEKNNYNISYENYTLEMLLDTLANL